MIAKIIIFTLINLALNSLSEKDFSIKAVYETTEPNENITLIHSYCDITKLNIDGEFIEISPDERNNFFIYSIIKGIIQYSFHWISQNANIYQVCFILIKIWFQLNF